MRHGTMKTIAGRAYMGALLALMIAVAGGALCNGLFFIAQPYQINYGEGLVASQAAHITDPVRAYAPIDRYPFVVFQYPPLFHLAARAAGTMTTGDLLRAGRLVSLLSAAILCVVIGWITFRALPRRMSWQMRMIAAAFAGVLPATLYNFHWTWLARVDTLAVLLSFSGVALFAARHASIPAQFLSSALMVAALFTRQTAFAAPIACLLVAFLIDRRIARNIFLTTVILGGGVLGWLAWWTHGQIFLHLLRYNQTEFSIGRAAFGLVMNARHVAGLLVLAAGASAAVLYGVCALARRRRWDLLSANMRANRYRRMVCLLAVYSVFAALSAVAFGKEGSDINYFLEWNVSLAPLIGILLFRIAPLPGVRLRPVWLAALAVPLLLLSAGLDQARDGWRRIFEGPLPADREHSDIFERTLAEVKGTPGAVFSEDMNLLYKSGKDIPADPAMIQYLAQAGMWDERPFVQMIQEHGFALIVAYDISSRERYSPAVAAAIRKAYGQTAKIGDYLILRPRTGVRVE